MSEQWRSEPKVGDRNRKDQIELAALRGGYASGQRYRVRGQFLFNGVQLSGAHILEVGCGKGAWSLWAALHGAERVVAIEPEAHGSTSNSLMALQQTIGLLGLKDKIFASGHYLQELLQPERPYDVVVMYDVINHLDEEAVVSVHCNPVALDRYVSIFSNLRRQIQPGGWLIVADCGRDNFWNQLGLRSPIATSIEWHKHQNPQVWIEVLNKANFKFHDLRWSPLQPFPTWTCNWFVQYLTCSHFVLSCRAA
jgi:2-polyprenyl-3-methyl-5-hydroxy-6-metoxy-1,4-benzoquinol methylase